MMQIAFEKLDKSLQHALIVSLSLFPKSFRRDAAFATGDDCTKTLTDLKRVLKGGGGGSDPISHIYFMKNPIPI